MESCRLLCSISVESVILLLLWQTACQSVVAAVRSETKPPSFSLHYTTGGDRTEDGERQMPGLYSGRLLPANENNGGPNINSTFDDLRQLDFGCAQVGNTVHNGLSIKSLSFDQSTQEVLLMEDAGDRINVMRGQLCHEQRRHCNGVPEWSKLPCILCKIATSDQGLLGPFASHSHTIYFIYIPDHVDHHSQLKHHKVLQLRMLTGCEDKYPIFNHLNVDMCSTVMATYTSSSHHMQPASDLTIMEVGTSLMFLTQARTYDWNDQARTNYYHVGMILVGFHKVSRKAGFRVHLLHDEDLPIHFLNLPLANSGGIGVYMMTVCWTIFDRVHCGRLNANGRNIISKVNVIEPGAVQDVCTGEHQNMTTGVAIVEAHKVQEITLIFGCTSVRSGEGGIGLVHFKVNKGERSTIMHKVHDNHGPVMGGSMFITRKVTCPTKSPTIEQPNMNSPAAADSSASGGLFLLVLIMLKLLGGY